MPRGKVLSENVKETIVEFYEDGYKETKIASMLNISNSSVLRVLQEKGIKQKIDQPVENNNIDLSRIEKKLDQIDTEIFAGFMEIKTRLNDIANPIWDELLSLESLGFKAKDERTYTKTDGDTTTVITFISNQQINYKKQDKYGKVIDAQYFNAQVIEAMYGAIRDRGWNYFR